jgi:hypothetical protein
MTDLIYPPVPGIAHAKTQSKHGPKLPKGFCLGSVAQFMLGHPSGQETATLGWKSCKHKHPFDGKDLTSWLHTVPRGFPLWLEGGTPTPNHPEGDGHVVITGVPMWCWSEDRLREGFYDRVAITSLLTWNLTHPLRVVGWSEDVCGFPVGYAPHSKDAHK